MWGASWRRVITSYSIHYTKLYDQARALDIADLSHRHVGNDVAGLDAGEFRAGTGIQAANELLGRTQRIVTRARRGLQTNSIALGEQLESYNFV